jgi:hypothetical protein
MQQILPVEFASQGEACQFGANFLNVFKTAAHAQKSIEVSRIRA